MEYRENSKAPKIRVFVEGTGQTVAAEVNLFDPDCMIRGGGLLQMDGWFPVKTLLEAVHRYVRKPYPEWYARRALFQTKPGERGVVGTAVYARKRMVGPGYL